MAKIINHPGHVGTKHAHRWVKQGHAAWVDGKLLLTERFRLTLGATRYAGPSVPGSEYDAINREMTGIEKHHIPLAHIPQRPTRRR